MIQSVLCLMMVLHGGFANPVASEGSAGSSLGFLASIGEAFFPLMTSIVSDEISESQIKVDDKLEHGRAYNKDTVTNLGIIWNVQKDTVCCETCKESYKETEFFQLTYKTMNTKAEMRDCKCLKSKTGVMASSHTKGQVVGKCGLWEYNGEGELGDGRVILGGSTDFLGVVTNVNAATSCCETCSAMGKFPATQLFEFSKEHKNCKCHKVNIDGIPETRAKEFTIGTCPATEVTEAPVEADVKEAVISEEVEGVLGDGKIYDPNTMTMLNYTHDASGKCCSGCAALSPEARFFTFSKDTEWCACFTPIAGVKPASIVPGSMIKDWMPNPVSGVCEAEKSGEEESVSNTSPPATQVAVSEEIVSSVENSGSNASPAIEEGGNNKPDAAALTIPGPQPEVCDGDFNCCPHPTDGDNTLGTEQFIQESQYKSDFSSCSDACKKLYPYSNGVTQSKTQTYKSNKLPFCWCEFGQYKFQASTGYQTCLFKPEEVVEDDYDY